jgi:ornithine decarboxylase
LVFLKRPIVFALRSVRKFYQSSRPLFPFFFFVVVVDTAPTGRRFFPRVEPFYAIKCNPDPVIVQTLAVLGCNFDCASRNEIRLVQDTCSQLSRQPDIIFANPCKPVSHLIESVARGVRLVTFDNAAEVAKCASVSGKIELVLRIITDDRGSQCRLSSKYGAPRGKWRPLLAAAKQHGLTVVGVSFHVGSGCRDATKYLKPLQDAREIFDMAETEFGMKLQLVDIGGGFPGETHSIWNPVVAIDEVDDDGGDTLEGKPSNDNGEADKNRFMFFQEIAQQVAPMIDELFPPESGIRIISEPGRYFTAAAATLCCSVISCRSNETDESYVPEPVNDKQAAKQVDAMTRQDERELVVRTCSGQLDSQKDEDEVMATIQEELKGFSKLFAAQQLTQQEVDVYNDSLDWFKEGFDTAIDMLGPPDKLQKHHRTHTVEGITYPLVAATGGGDDQDKAGGGLLPVTLSAAGEAAVKGLVLQAVADSAPLQDDFAYYINEGIYGGTSAPLLLKLAVSATIQ